MDTHAVKELVKSFLRFLYFGLLGLVGTFITSLAASQDLQNTVINIGDTYLPVGAVLFAALTGVVKMIDKYVRVSKGNDLNGIAPNFLQR